MNVFNNQEYKQHSASGTFSGTAAAGTKNGTAVPVNDVEDGTLSAYLAVAIVTSSFTITPKWMVSQDNSTYLAIEDQNNTAVTAISATETTVLEAPKASAGWPYTRLTLVAGGTTGTTGDTYEVSYTYRKRQAGW